MTDLFPSPCGDKLKYVKSVSYLMKYEVFPSPCGDKLKSGRQVRDAQGRIGFRPLAGIS